MNAKAISVALWGLGSIACLSTTGNDAQVVQLRTDRESYALGQSIHLTLTNQGPHDVIGGLNCNVEIHRWTGVEWEKAEGVVCRLFGEVPRLKPGDSDSVVIGTGSRFSVAPRVFRCAGKVQDATTGEYLDVHSPPFTVTD